MIKTLIIAVDGSNYSQEAMSTAKLIGKKFDARFKFTTVIDSRSYEWGIIIGSEGFTPFYPSMDYQDEVRKGLQNKADEILKRCEDFGKNNDLEYTTKKVVGHPAEMLLEESKCADLLLLGRQGEHAKDEDENLLGSVANRIIRKSIKPLIIVSKAPSSMENILVGYDGSEFSNHALQWSAELADRIEMHLDVVIVDSSQARIQKRSQQVDDYLEPFDIEYKNNTYYGTPEEIILEQSKEKEIDLIAIGGSSHSKIRDALLGSTAEHIIRQSSKPVLLAR